MPTVSVVDDDDDFRESLLSLLAALGYSAAGYASADDYLRRADPSVPGCLMLDIRMPGRNGIDFYRELVQTGRKRPVIFITAHADVSTAVAAMKTGAIEFLEKPFRKEVLRELVERAFRLDAEWQGSEERFRRLDAAIQGLSQTDLETLTLILTGETNKAMAARLFISERAVELRRQRLMQKLGVRTVPELLDLAITHRVLAELRSIRGELA